MGNFKRFFKKKVFLFLVFFFSLLLFYALSGLVFNNFSPNVAHSKNYDTSLDWTVLDGRYCSVIFPAGILTDYDTSYEHIALHIANLADEIYTQITPQFGEPFHKNKRFTIILEDFSDSAYGFATTMPHRLIRVNLTVPGPEIFDTKFESWLRILLAHEYTHLAHFDMTDKITTFLHFFLGQIITPNALQPLWSIEGLAIYNESRLNTGGRLTDNRYEMYLRTDFMENSIKNPALLEGSYLVSWPGGNIPYIYGQSLVHYIASHYGEEKLIAISEQFSSFPLSGMDWALKKILGITQEELYQQWQEEKEHYFNQQIEQIISAHKITESQQITNHRYWVEKPSWIVDNTLQNTFLVYKVFTPHLYPTIRKYNLNSQKESVVVKRTAGLGTSYSFSPDSQYLLYSKLVQYDQYYSYQDLFLYHLNSGKQFQLTEKLRIKDPSWYPDPAAGRAAAIINQAGTNNLVLFSLKTPLLDGKFDQPEIITSSDLIYLTDFNDGTQISQPVWSPRGNQLALSLWHKGYQDIYIITFDNYFTIQSIRPIAIDRYTDINPCWSGDGKYLYFCSDRSGIYNIYAYSLADEKLFQLTNVVTGAFEPAIAPDSKDLAYIQYHSSGYELHLVKSDDLLWESVEKPEITPSIILPALKNDKVYFPEMQPVNNEENTRSKLAKITSRYDPGYTLKKYSPRNSILPTYWVPYFGIIENNLYLGLSAQAQDYLEFYQIPATIAYSPFYDSLFYSCQLYSYINEPSLSLSWEGETSSYTEFQLTLRFNDSGYTSQGDSGRLFSRNFSIGVQSEYLWANQEPQAELPLKDSTLINSLLLRYAYNDTEKYQWSSSPELGNSYSLSYQYGLPFPDSETTFHKFLFDSRKYFSLPHSHQVVALRLVAGHLSNQENEERQFSLGGSISAQNLSSVNTKNFSLRGFPSSSFAGNNLLLGSLEYRFPLKKPERKIGFHAVSVFLEQVSGTLFLEAGQVWNETLLPSFEDIKISMGGEIVFTLKLRYTEPLLLSLGIGKAISEPLPARFYGRIGLSF